MKGGKGATFEMTGLDKFQKKLMSMEKNLQHKVVRTALREEMKEFQSDAKAYAPKDDGQIKKNIKVRASKRSRKSIGINVSLHKDTFKDNYYGAFQEFGTSKIKPKGFLRQSFDSNVESSMQSMEATLIKAMLKAIGGK